MAVVLLLTSILPFYRSSIEVRADTRTVEEQRQSVLNRVTELENQYTERTVSQYTLLYNLRIITELGMYVKLIDGEASLNFNSSEKNYYCTKYQKLIEKFNSMYSVESTKYNPLTLDTENYYYENVRKNLIEVIPKYLEANLAEVQTSYDGASDDAGKEKVLKDNTVLLSNVYKIIMTYQDVQTDLTNLTPLNADGTSKVFSIVNGENNETAKGVINNLITKYSKILTIGKEAYEENLKSIELSVSDTEDYITELCDAEVFEGQVVTKESYTLKGAYFAILAASGTYVPLQSYAGNDTFTRSLIKLAPNESTAKNLVNLYNNTKDYRKPLYKREIDSNGNPTGTAKLITIEEFFDDIKKGNSGALVAANGRLRFSPEANAWVYYRDELTDAVTAAVQDSFGTNDDTNTKGEEVSTEEGQQTAGTQEITIDSLEKNYEQGEKAPISNITTNSVTDFQKLLVDLVETKEDYDYAQRLNASATIVNPITSRFTDDCKKLKSMNGVSNFSDPKITDTVGTILATVLNIKYQKVKISFAVSKLQMATYAYQAFSQKTGRTCYEDATKYLVNKPISTYINGLSLIYGGNEVSTDNAQSYTEKAIASTNANGIFAYTGEITKNCVVLSSAFNEKNINGFSKSTNATFEGVGTKFKYVISRYKSNGFYYPENTEKASGSVNDKEYDFKTGKLVADAGLIDSLFNPVTVYAEPTSGDVDEQSNDMEQAGQDNQAGQSVVTTEESVVTTEEKSSVVTENAEANDLDNAMYAYDEITDENILTQPLFFYSTEYSRAVDNLTTMLMRNILENASSLSNIENMSSRFLYVNCYGDIVTDDNLVILPGAANPLLYTDDSAYNPYTVAFMNNYPSIVVNSENLQFTSKNDVGKYLLMANTKDENFTDADVTGYLINGNDSVDDTSKVVAPKIQREFYTNGVDSINILSTGRYAVDSYVTWKNSDLYEWSSIVMKQTPTVDNRIIFPYDSSNDTDQLVAATITSNLYTYFTKEAESAGGSGVTSKLNDNYICHNFIFCNSNGTNNPVGYSKNFQLQYDTYVKNTLERFTTQLISLSKSLIDKITSIDGVIGLKDAYTDPILGNVLSAVKQVFWPFMIVMAIIFLAAFMKMRRDLFETGILTVVSLVVIYLFVNVVPIYLPMAYNSVINNVSEVLSYKVLGTATEVNDVEDTHVSNVNENGDYIDQTTSLTLYAVGSKDFKDFADSLNVSQDDLVGGKKYIIDQASGLYAEGNKLKINADILFDTLPITGTVDESGEGTYTVKATKTVSNNLDYYVPYYQIVDGFIENLNSLAKIYDIPRKATTYADSKTKDSYLVYSFVNSPVFVTPGEYKQPEVQESNLSEDEKAKNDTINANVESALTETFGTGTDFLGIGDLLYNLDKDQKKTLWAQTLKKNGYYDANWVPKEEKLNDLVVYVNYQTKKFIYDMDDLIGTMSDDAMIKLISLRALVAFTQEASQYGSWMYPYCINYNEFSLGDIIRTIYTTSYNAYVNLDMDIVNYVGNDLGWFHLVIFDLCVILLYVIVSILKVLVPVLYLALAVLIIVKLFTQNDIKTPITGYLKCNLIIFSLFTIISLSLVGVSKLNGNPIGLYVTLFVLLFCAYVLANLLRALVHFTDLGNETINAKVIGFANKMPFRRSYNDIVVNSTDVNINGRNQNGVQRYERSLYDSYRIDRDVDEYNDFSRPDNYFTGENDIVTGLHHREIDDL